MKHQQPKAAPTNNQNSLDEQLFDQIWQILDFNEDPNTGGYATELLDYYRKRIKQVIHAAFKAGQADVPPHKKLEFKADSIDKIAFDFLPLDHQRHQAKLKLRIEALLRQREAAINKTIMEDVLASLPNKRYSKNIIPGVGAEATDEEYGYNQALEDVRQQITKKYGSKDHE